MARPTTYDKIDVKQFEQLCAIQCTKEEICAVLDVTDKTLDKFCKDTYELSFSEVFKLKRKIGHVSLRRSSFKLAQKNVAMNIFLLKNWLGMTDKQEIENTINLPKEIKNEIIFREDV